MSFDGILGGGALDFGSGLFDGNQNALLNLGQDQNLLQSDSLFGSGREFAQLGSLDQVDPLGGGGQGGIFENLDMGDIGSILKGFSSLYGAYNASQMAGIAQDQLDFTKDYANRNIANQAKLINSKLEDRQNARIGSTGRADQNVYQDTSSYLKQNAVDGRAIG